jgi:hypothetical protein
MLSFTSIWTPILVAITTVIFASARIKVRRIAARRVVTGVTGHLACVTVLKKTGDAMGFVLFTGSYAKSAVSILVPPSRPLPTIVGTAHIDLGPEAGKLCVG